MMGRPLPTKKRGGPVFACHYSKCLPITRNVQQDDVIDLLRRSGRALHGERWQVSLSRDLGITDRALRYWLDGTNTVPVDEVLPKLLTILLVHKAKLDDVIGDVRAIMGIA